MEPNDSTKHKASRFDSDSNKYNHRKQDINSLNDLQKMNVRKYNT
ncbi:hypothetical protein [Paenibacillus sp. FSL H8-0168]